MKKQLDVAGGGQLFRFRKLPLMDIEDIKLHVIAAAVTVGPRMDNGMAPGDFQLSSPHAKGVLGYLSLNSPFADGLQGSGGWRAGVQITCYLDDGHTVDIQFNKTLSLWRAYDIVSCDCTVMPGLLNRLSQARLLSGQNPPTV